MARTPKPSGRRKKKPVLTHNSLHLIYSEGSKTEPLYVLNIEKEIRKNFKDKTMPVKIEVVPDHGMSTLGLVRYAELDVQKKLTNGYKIDHVWIFYDKDSFLKDDFDNAHHKIINKNKSENKNANYDREPSDSNGIRWHSVWSNECFEIWVLLHFIYLESVLSRETYIPKTDEYLGSGVYAKNLDNLYDLLKENGDIEKAIRFAKRLERQNGLNNPSTGLYQFIEHFKLYLKINEGRDD